MAQGNGESTVGINPLFAAMTVETHVATLGRVEETLQLLDFTEENEDIDRVLLHGSVLGIAGVAMHGTGVVARYIDKKLSNTRDGRLVLTRDPEPRTLNGFDGALLEDYLTFDVGSDAYAKVIANYGHSIVGILRSIESQRLLESVSLPHRQILAKSLLGIANVAFDKTVELSEATGLVMALSRDRAILIDPAEQVEVAKEESTSVKKPPTTDKLTKPRKPRAASTGTSAPRRPRNTSSTFQKLAKLGVERRVRQPRNPQKKPKEAEFIEIRGVGHPLYLKVKDYVTTGDGGLPSFEVKDIKWAKMALRDLSGPALNGDKAALARFIDCNKLFSDFESNPNTFIFDQSGSLVQDEPERVREVTAIVDNKDRSSAERSFIDPEKEWLAYANCYGVDPELFFPERGASTREAKEVCKGCVVRDDCLEFALDKGEKFGIWGGLSERERRRIRRRRKIEAADVKKAAAKAEADSSVAIAD